MSIESVMPSNHLSLCHPLLLPRTLSLSTTVKQGSKLRWHFQDLNPGVPIFVYCPFYVTKLHPGQPQEDATRRQRCLQFLPRAWTSVSSWYSCLSFPTVYSPHLHNLPLLPSQRFPPPSIPPSTHSSFFFLPHFICWLAHSLSPPVSPSLALCSPQALPPSECLSLSHVQDELLLLPPL